MSKFIRAEEKSERVENSVLRHESDEKKILETEHTSGREENKRISHSNRYDAPLLSRGAFVFWEPHLAEEEARVVTRGAMYWWRTFISEHEEEE